MWKTMMAEVAQIRMMPLNLIRFGHNGTPHGGKQVSQRWAWLIAP